MWGLTPQKGICPHVLLCLLRPPFVCVTLGANQVVLWYDLKLASGCVVSDVSWDGLPCRPISALPVTGLQLNSSSYKAVCGGLLLMLDLEVCESGLLVN